MKSPRVVLLLFFSVVVLGFALFIAWEGYERYREKEILSEKVKKLQEEANTLQQETKKLQDKISYLRTPEYIEREAKEKLNLKKPGENVALIQSDRFQSELTEQAEEVSRRGVHVTIKGDISNPRRWWNYFFGA